ncbi:MAG: tetratricopeptide repeat protein, partial [Actinoallomurus sp.]
QLPLAVRIAAARLAARPTWHLATFAERLSDERRLLDELVVGDLEVRGSVALSYQLLDDDQRRLFRLLGHLPGLDFPGWVTMPLADTSRAAAERLIESLVEARLVEAVRGDGSGFARYRLHDLLRVFARERSAADDRPQDVRAALGRLYGAWLFLAERADERLGFGQHLARIGRSEGPRWAPDTVTARVTGDPLAWMERERALLVASVLHASELGLWHIAWDLAACLTRFLQARWHVDDWRVTHETALEAARAAGDDRGEAAILRAIAEMHMDHDRYDEALACLRTAAEIFTRDGDELGRAHIRRAIAKAHRMLGRPEVAFACLREALPVFEAHGDEPGLACALYALGGVHRESGRYDEALVAYQRARDLFRRLGDPHNEANVLCGMGTVLQAVGRVADAEDLFTESLAMAGDHDIWAGEMFAYASLGALHTDTGDLRSADGELAAALSISEEFGDRFGKALSLSNLGELRRRQGRPGEARSHLRQAQALFPPLFPPAELP